MKRGLTIVIVVLVIVAIGAGILWYLGSKSLDTKTTNDLGFIKIAQKDTDNDGLSDNLEKLWGTNPDNPDTNGDGISDNKSIEENIDPVKASSTPITGVDMRLQALIQNAVTKKGAPLVNDSPNSLPYSLVFAEKDLQTTDVETAATIVKFRDDMRQVLRTYFPQFTGEEQQSLIKFLNEGDEAAIITISVEREKYADMLKGFAAITVPASAVKPYLGLLNSLGKVVEMINYMTQIKTEPLLALKSSQLLPQTRGTFWQNFVPVNNYLMERGVMATSTADTL